MTDGEEDDFVIDPALESEMLGDEIAAIENRLEELGEEPDNEDVGGPQDIEATALVAEWGSEFEQNLEHAEFMHDHLSENAPSFMEVMSTPVQLADGTEYLPVNDPQWIKMEALFGRLLAHRDGIESDFEANRRAPAYLTNPAQQNPAQPQAITAPTEKEAIQDRLDELYQLVGTEKYKHPKVQKEIHALERALGDAPVVGGGGRYA